MIGRVLAVLVDPRVQARVVVVVNFFVADCLMVEQDGIGSPSVKCFVGIRRTLETQVGDEGGHVGVVSLHL